MESSKFKIKTNLNEKELLDYDSWKLEMRLIEKEKIILSM